MSAVRAAWALVRKDIAIWARQPPAIAATVLPPIVFMIVIFVASAAVGRNPVALVVLDHGPQAQRLTSILQSSDAFRVQTASPEDAQNLLNNLQVAAVITIPSDFDARYDAGRPDPVTIRINNLNLDFTNDLRRSLPAAITHFYAQQSQSPVDMAVQETDLRSQDVSILQFLLIPNLVLMVTVAGIVNCGLATAREFEDVTIKELLLAPIHRTTLIAGKLLAGWLTTLLVAGVVLVLGAVTGVLRPTGWYALLAIGEVALLSLAMAGLGAAVGSLLQRLIPTIAIGVNLSIYLFFLSGGISVVAFLPDWVQTIAHFTPSYYGVHALQMAIFYHSTEQLGRDLAVLFGTAVVTLMLGVLALRRRAVA